MKTRLISCFKKASFFYCSSSDILPRLFQRRPRSSNVDKNPASRRQKCRRVGVGVGGSDECRQRQRRRRRRQARENHLHGRAAWENGERVSEAAVRRRPRTGLSRRCSQLDWGSSKALRKLITEIKQHWARAVIRRRHWKSCFAECISEVKQCRAKRVIKRDNSWELILLLAQVWILFFIGGMWTWSKLLPFPHWQFYNRLGSFFVKRLQGV